MNNISTSMGFTLLCIPIVVVLCNCMHTGPTLVHRFSTSIPTANIHVAVCITWLYFHIVTSALSAALSLMVINPRRAHALARVTVVGLCVSVCLSVRTKSASTSI